MNLVKVLILVVVVMLGSVFGYDQQQQQQQQQHQQQPAMSMGTKMVLKMFDECMRDDGFSICLKRKFLTFIDRLSRIENLSISENIKIIKDGDVKEDDSYNKISRSFDESKGKSFSQKDELLSSIIVDKVVSYFNGRKIEIDLPKIASSDVSRSLEEGRGKMKKMMSMMMAGAAMKMAAMLPMAIAFLFVLSGKALMVAKIALLLAGIMALKKIMQNRGHSSGWQSSGSGGWDRSIKMNPDAQHLAYSAYVPSQ